MNSLFLALTAVAALSFLPTREVRAEDDDPPQPQEERPEPVQQSGGPAPAPLAPPPSESALDRANGSALMSIPPPQPVPTIAPPAPHPKVRTEKQAERGKLELATPRVEILRANANTRQRVARVDKRLPRAGRLGPAFISGEEPVTLVLRFAPSYGGKRVEIRATSGISITPPSPAVLLAPTGEALLQVAFLPECRSGQLAFEIENVRTVLPLMRAPAEIVSAAEAADAEEVVQ